MIILHAVDYCKIYTYRLYGYNYACTAETISSSKLNSTLRAKLRILADVSALIFVTLTVESLQFDELAGH